MEEIKITNEAKKILEKRSKALNMNLSEVIEFLDKIELESKVKPKEEKTMVKEIDEGIDPVVEVKNNKLNLQSEMLFDIKELLSAIKADISSKTQLINQGISDLKKPNPDALKIGEELGTLKTSLSSLKTSQDSLRSEIKESLTQRDISGRLEFLRLDLNTANEKLSSIMQPPILTPQIVEALTKLKNRWQKNNLSEVVMDLLGNLTKF